MKHQLLEKTLDAFDGEVDTEVVSATANYIFKTRDGEISKLQKG